MSIKDEMMATTVEIANQAKAEKDAAVAVFRMKHGAPAGVLLEALLDALGSSKLASLHLDDAPARVKRDVLGIMHQQIGGLIDAARQAAGIDEATMSAITSCATGIIDKINAIEKNLLVSLESIARTRRDPAEGQG